MVVIGVVATNNAGRNALTQRTGSGYLRTLPQDSNNGEIGSGVVRGASYFGRARAEASLPRPSA